MIEIIGTGLTQWDTGRSVNVTGIEASHVHFANPGDSQAPIIELAESMAKIPDYLLRTGKQLCVYAVNNGVTVESRIFPVRKRERPENYVYEDDQRNYIYELIQSAEKAIDDANNAAKRAEEASKIDAVLFVEQDLTEAQKAQARKNIGVSSSGGGGESTVENAVLYTPQELGDDQKAQARENLYVPSTADFEDLSLTVDRHRNEFEEANYQLGLRVSELEKGGSDETAEYRHIFTYEHTADEGVKQIDITQDKDGNGFSCKEFLIFTTFPATGDGATQLYMGRNGATSYKWLAYLGDAMSKTAQRCGRIELRHTVGGAWVCDASYVDTTSLFTVGNACRGSVKSNDIVEKVDKLQFWAQGVIAKGAIIEIFGK